MIHLDIKTHGGPEMRAWLAKGEKLDEPIGRALGEWATETLDGQLYGSANYAPPPPNSRYIRTGTLGAGWGLSRHSQTGVTFLNMTSYTGYVVGNEEGGGQAGIHAGRWWLARKRIEDRLDAAVERISDDVTKALS